MEGGHGELGLSRRSGGPATDGDRSGRPLRSGRVPDDFEPNPLARLLAEKRAEGRSVLDLTVTNPTKVGLGSWTPQTARLPDVYEPDPRGSRAARQAIARYVAEREGRDAISPDRLILTASTSESYAHLFRLLCEPGDEVVVPTPSYPLFEPLARLEGVVIREYELRRHPAGRWSVDLDALEAAAGPRARAILLVQPNHPTGSCVTPEELVSIEDVAARRGLALVSDEVFGDFPWPPGSRVLPSLLAGPRRVPTFVLGGISKLCGLPQMKLGWIAVTGPEREAERALEGLEWIADLFLSVSAPVEAALPGLLARRHGFQAAVRDRLARNLEHLRLATSLEHANATGRGAFRLLESEGGWSAVLGSEREPADLAASGFAAAPTANSDDADTDLAEQILERHDVLVHPGHFYGLSDRHIVISLIVEPSVLKEALDRLNA